MPDWVRVTWLTLNFGLRVQALESVCRARRVSDKYNMRKSFQGCTASRSTSRGGARDSLRLPHYRSVDAVSLKG